MVVQARFAVGRRSCGLGVGLVALAVCFFCFHFLGQTLNCLFFMLSSLVRRFKIDMMSWVCMTVVIVAEVEGV